MIYKENHKDILLREIFYNMISHDKSMIICIYEIYFYTEII